MIYGQQQIDGNWYCFDLGTGKMKTGLTKLSRAYEPAGEKTVYYDPASGKMQYGLTMVQSLYRYFDLGTGALQKNSVIQDNGYIYRCDQNGVITNIEIIKKMLSGIDISHWQADIDLSNITSDFVILKASGGNGYNDPSFVKFADTVLSSNRLLGFYHFARDKGYKGKASEEAIHFYNSVKNYIGKGIPILNWEEDIYLGPEWAIEFMDTFYGLSGVKPLIYMSASVTRDYDWSVAVRKGYKLWLAQYANMNVVSGHQTTVWRDSYGNGSFEHPIMQQYTSTGQLEGYRGNLDLDIFYGSQKAWWDLCQKS